MQSLSDLTHPAYGNLYPSSPNLGCLPEGWSAVECWVDDHTGEASDGNGPLDRPSVYICRASSGYDDADYWIGPLDVAILGASMERFVRVRRTATDNYMVELYENGGRTDLAEWGNSADRLEEAWRFALAAFYGPVDDGYNEHQLARHFAQIADPPPPLMTPTAVERWLTT